MTNAIEAKTTVAGLLGEPCMEDFFLWETGNNAVAPASFLGIVRKGGRLLDTLQVTRFHGSCGFLHLLFQLLRRQRLDPLAELIAFVGSGIELLTVDECAPLGIHQPPMATLLGLRQEIYALITFCCPGHPLKLVPTPFLVPTPLVDEHRLRLCGSRFRTSCDIIRVRLNQSYSKTASQWKSLGCHEFGHTGDIGHRNSSNDTDGNSCMRSDKWYLNYDSHDISAINESV